MHVLLRSAFPSYVILISIARVEEKSRVVFIEYIYAATSCTNVHVWEIAIWSFRGK